jgi:GTPase SAR1 family protein
MADSVAVDGPLDQEARELAADVLRLADERGREDVARLLGVALEPRTDRDTTVVVVGETNRGKSAFVNALVGADVTPADTDVSTNAFIIVRHAERPTAIVHRGGTQPEEIPVGSVGDWATVAGNPGNAKRVRAVEVGVDHPLLRKGLRLIDTPGVGGLDANHRRVTLAALQRADALVFVTDPNAPFSRTEHAFLRDATRRIRTVVFVLTKIDDYVHWNVILRDDRALLASHAPEFAASPFLAVSNVDKREADVLGDAALRADSGFEAVEHTLEAGVLSRSASLRLGNLVKAVDMAVEELDRRERQASAHRGRATEIRRALEQAQQLQQELAQQTEGWGSKLNVDFQRHVRNRFEPTFKRAVTDMVRRWEERIRSSDADLRQLPEDLEAELQAIAIEMEGLIVDSSAQVAAALGKLYELAPDELAKAVERESETLLDIAPLPTAEVARAGQPLVGGAAAVAAGALAGGKYALLFGPQGLLIGAGAGALLGGLTWTGGKRLGRQAAGQQAALQVVQAAAATARIDLDAYLRERLLATQAALQETLKQLIVQRRTDLRQAVEEQKRYAAADEREQERVRERARSRLRETEPLRSRATSIARQVS